MSAMSAAMSSQTPMNANNKQAPFGEMIPWVRFTCMFYFLLLFYYTSGFFF